MPFPTRSLIVYNGSDSLPANDYTDATDWEQTELGSMAVDGDASSGTWLVRDEGGLIPDYKVPTYLSAHSVVKVTVGSNTLFRGRIAAHEQFRGRQKASRANEVTLTLEDQNSHLRGIIVHNWVRGAETDVARVQGLAASYLSGSPRVTTNLNGSNYVITGSNTITQPAKTYSGVTPYEIMQELAGATDKQFFVTIDNELAYFGNDYTGYASQLRISDDIADANATTYAPIDPRSSVFDREVLSAIRSYYGTDPISQTYALRYAGVESFYDYWEGVLWDNTSVTAAQAAVVAAAEAAYRRSGDATFTCSIGPMSGDEIYKIKAGQTIQVKARAARGGRTVAGVYSGDSFATGRVGEIRWTMPAPDVYFAHLSLDNKKRPKGSQALATQPEAAPVASSGSGTTLIYWDWTTGVNPSQTDVCTAAGGNPWGDGSGHNLQYSASLYVNTIHYIQYTHQFAVTAGTTIQVTIPWSNYGDSPIASLTAKWYKASCASADTPSTTVSNLPVGHFQDGSGTMATAIATFVVPTGATSCALAGDFNGVAESVRVVQLDTVSTPDPYALPSSGGTSPYYARSDDPRFIDIDTDDDLVITRHLTNNSGVNVDWGDVVVQDPTSNDAFRFNSNTAYSSGWIGVAQQPIGSNSTGKVLLSGYTPVINVGSNSTTRGHFLFGSNANRRAYGAAARGTGSFGQVLTTSVAPDAIIWTASDSSGGSLTDHDHTATGDGGDLTGGLIGNYIDATEQSSAPASPAAGKVRLFSSNTNFYQKSSGGTVTRLSGTGGSSGGSGLPSGTSFPSASSGDTYYRTDLGEGFEYDGTRWLSLTIYSHHWSGENVTGLGLLTRIPVSGWDIWAVALEMSAFIVTTNNASNYHNWELNKTTTANVSTNVGTVNTSGFTTGTWQSAQTAIGIALARGTYPVLYLNMVSTGGPTGAYYGLRCTYRRIAT